MLRAKGFLAHLLYDPLEGLTRAQETAMGAEWDFFHVLPSDRRRPIPEPARHFAVDDWFDPRLGPFAALLDRRWRFELCIANYVWMSAVLGFLPARVFKVVDTHDRFADRHTLSARSGLDPHWFYTSAAEERAGLKRADLVLAIQDSEAAKFRDYGLARVETVGLIMPARFLPPRPRRDRLRIGYLGSANPWNVRAIERFHAALAARPMLTEKLYPVLAGPICAAVSGFNTLFHPLGIVDDPARLYAEVDLVINPAEGGTGLKIKTIEAFGYGVPLLSMRDGSVGTGTERPEHQLPSIAALVDAVAAVESGAIDLPGLAAHSRRCFTAYTARQVDSFDRAFPPVLGGSDAAASVSRRITASRAQE
jgi:hypothetical protein